jgi:hypothetical protein
MPTPVIYEEPVSLGGDTALQDRVDRLEAEVGDLRGSVSRLAELVVIDIKERRDVREQVETRNATLLPAESRLMDSMANSTALATLVPVPVSPSAWSVGRSAIQSLRKPWLIVELLRETGSALRMYLDPRYRVRRSTQMMVPLLLGLIALNYIVFAQLFDIWIISPISERLIFLVLAVLLYKLVSREVTRYRESVAEAQAQAVAESTGSVVHYDSPAPHTRVDLE